MKNFLAPLILLTFSLSCSEENDTPSNLKIGDNYEGGVIFYILQPGDPSYIEGEAHGFVVGEDLAIVGGVLDGKYGYGYNCNVYEISNYVMGKLSDDLGMGENNTKVMAQACDDNIAALVLSEGWYLPNRNEAIKLHENILATKIELTDDLYWTSSFIGGVILFNYITGELTIETSLDPLTLHKIKPIKRF